MSAGRYETKLIVAPHYMRGLQVWLHFFHLLLRLSCMHWQMKMAAAESLEGHELIQKVLCPAGFSAKPEPCSSGKKDIIRILSGLRC